MRKSRLRNNTYFSKFTELVNGEARDQTQAVWLPAGTLSLNSHKGSTVSWAWEARALVGSGFWGPDGWCWRGSSEPREEGGAAANWSRRPGWAHRGKERPWIWLASAQSTVHSTAHQMVRLLIRIDLDQGLLGTISFEAASSLGCSDHRSIISN